MLPIPAVSLLPGPVALLAAGLTAVREYAVGENESKAGPMKSLGSSIICFHSVFWSLEQFLAHSIAEAQQKKSEYMREKD